MTTAQSTAAPDAQGEWGTEQLDLDAYLARIGYDGPRTPTVETLVALHRAHVAHISFETVGLALGTPVQLDLKTLQERIVERGHGGCCLENNLLFGAVLESLGFTVTRLLARVRRGNPAIRYRSHAVLLVEAGGRRWLADVGFGDEGPLEPLILEDGAQLTVGEWTWRLDLEGEDWILRCLHTDGWFDVFSVDLQPQHWIDFQMSNFYTCNNPASPFMGQLVAQRPDTEVRHVLRNHVLVTQHPDGRREHAELTGGEVVRALRETFRVTLTDEEAKALSQRFSAAPPATGGAS